MTASACEVRLGEFELLGIGSGLAIDKDYAIATNCHETTNPASEQY